MVTKIKNDTSMCMATGHQQQDQLCQGENDYAARRGGQSQEYRIWTSVSGTNHQLQQHTCLLRFGGNDYLYGSRFSENLILILL